MTNDHIGMGTVVAAIGVLTHRILRALDDLLLKSLEKDLVRRPPSAGALRGELEKIAIEVPCPAAGNSG